MFLKFCMTGLAIASLAFVASFPSGVAQAKTQYIRPDSPTYKPLRGREPEIRYQRDGSRIVFTSPEPRGEEWVYNASMSRACRRGKFKQRANRRYVALFGEDVYGAAVGGHASLVDEENLSEPQTLYVFKGQGTTSCSVYHRSR
ncbi:MAG: hypothetical protein R3245_05365 [Kiloniellales bacterium]|nr:hypothetical protein [Kiloniellales bacterium]